MSGPVNNSDSGFQSRIQQARDFLAAQAHSGRQPEGMALVQALRERAEAAGDVRMSELADQLEQAYRGRDMAALAADVYQPGGPGSTAPDGWIRASADPDTLAGMGLTAEAFAPTDTGFRAELYLPDPAVQGPDAVPVLAFKGTEFTSMEDWANNFLQGTGNQADYYTRAMTLAREVSLATDGRVAFTGHSLGGGMAAAAAEVTGHRAWTYNAAGLHDGTATAFIAENGGTLYVADHVTTAFQVDGDVLTSLQDAAPGLSPAGSDRLAQLIQFGLRSGDNALVQRAINGVLSAEDLARFEPLLEASGEDLRNLPAAPGEAVGLEALQPDGSPRTALGTRLEGDGGILQRVERLVSNTVGPIAVGNEIGRAPGQLIIDAGEAARSGLSGLGGGFDNAASGAGSALGGALQEQGQRWSVTVSDAVTGQVLAVSEGVSAVNSALSAAGEGANQALTSVGDGVGRGLAGFSDGVRGAADDAAQGIADGGDRLADGARRIPVVGGLFGSAVDAGSQVLQGAVRIGGQTVAGGSDLLGGGVRFTLDQAGNIVEGLGDGTGNVVQGTGEAAGRIWSGAGQLAAGAIEHGSRAAGGTIEGAGRLIGGAGNLVFSGIGEGTAALANGIGSPIRSVGGALGTAVAAPVAIGGAVATFATDPVLRDFGQLGADLGEMVHRHGMDVVDAGLDARISELERQAEVLLSR
ncbi:MAG: hypothetical protein ACXIUZ_05955 [Lysobacteraceae bacterium]